MKQINLTVSHRGGSNSYSFSGRPNGEGVRLALGLSQKDEDTESYMISMPKDTTSFNPSFYLGLLFDSIISLGGVEQLLQKYTFNIDSIDSQFKDLIQKDLDECERKARNEFTNFKKK